MEKRESKMIIIDDDLKISNDDAIKIFKKAICDKNINKRLKKLKKEDYKIILVRQNLNLKEDVEKYISQE